MLRDALNDLTVIDFTHVGAGPTCTMLLADLGARVIKIEPPEGELGRKLGPAWIGEDSALFHGFNRNKLGLGLDLKAEAGIEVARRLIETADILVESMRPGVMLRLGLGYEALREINPRLVYCSISAYGQEGPYADRAGVDGILQADSGLMSIIGSEGAEPVKVQAPIVDVFTGYVAAMGILTQLRKSAAEGKGTHLDVNLFSASIALQQVSLTNYLADGTVPEKIGSAAPYSAPNEAFETLDGWIMLAAYNGGRWERLCDILDLAELKVDPRFSTSSKRVANRCAMRNILGDRFRTRSRDHWLAALHAADILCAPVATYDDVLDHPQLRANGMIATLAHPLFGSIRMPGFPINSREMNNRQHRPAPERGGDSRAILETFGFSKDEIEALVRKNTVHEGRTEPQRAALA